MDTQAVPQGQQFITLAEASRRTGVSIATLRRRVKDGTLPTALIANRYRVRIADVDAWMTGGRAS